MKIDYLQFGQRKKPAILFLHGWQQDKRSFSPLVPFLHSSYCLFLLDLPGFGKSDLPPPKFSSFEYAKVIASWARQKKLKKVVLVGHSFGGKVAAIIAACYPRLASKLILIASAGLPHPKRWYRLKSLLPRWLQKTISPVFRPILASRDYKQAGQLLPIFKTIVQEDLRPIFSKIKTLTLIIWGKDDQELSPKDGEKIHQLIKNSQLVIVKGNHFPFWQNPSKIAKLIDEFIKK